MAKQPPPKGATSRIRFIMLEAELPQGDLDQITSAIQNALKPKTIVQHRLISPSAVSPIAEDSTTSESDIADTDLDGAVDEAPTIAEQPRPPREQRNRKPTVPKVLDVDLNSEVSLASFAGEHSPESDPDRNLVIAAWFKEHRKEDAITANHIYTGYRALKWPSGIDDFSWPLRYLKKEQLMGSPNRGQYSINHLGLARVATMRKE